MPTTPTPRPALRFPYRHAEAITMMKRAADAILSLHPDECREGAMHCECRPARTYRALLTTIRRASEGVAS